jgi:hypothetical protein
MGVARRLLAGAERVTAMLFLPRDRTFFDLFDRAADNMVHTAEMFLEMLRNMEIREQFAAKIREAEHTDRKSVV